jgi:hypothetical protein
VSFLKMDIEGFEPKALKGAANSLRVGKIKVAFIELCKETLARNGESAEDLMQQLHSFNFALYFCSLWDKPDPFKLKWKMVDVGGTPLRFAPAHPLPASYSSGDILAVHQSTELFKELD